MFVRVHSNKFKEKSNNTTHLYSLASLNFIIKHKLLFRSFY